MLIIDNYYSHFGHPKGE